MPDALYFTEDEAANRLLADDPFALLVGFALDQQVTVQQAFLGPLRLKERLGTLEPAAVAKADLEPLFREKPAIHRFPGSMAGRVQAMCRLLVDDYGGQADRIWSDVPDGATLFRRLKALPGFGDAKARITVALLGKQYGVTPPGWREAAGDYGEKKVYRSVADITDDASLARVRAYKKERKAAAKAAADR
jgi:uncharacterized HhH-GPD family protein